MILPGHQMARRLLSWSTPVPDLASSAQAVPQLLRRPEGFEQRIVPLNSSDGPSARMAGMASTLVFLLVRRVLGLVGLGPKPDDKTILAWLTRPGATRPRCRPGGPPG
jgi:hypothetical protein